MIVIALGANLSSVAGTPEKTIAVALETLARRGIMPVAVSAMYATAAWPDPNDPPFVNAAAEIETSLTPDALMRELELVEVAFGRIRTHANAPRTLDIDLIDFNGLVRERDPTLPHPRMDTRAFVLIPLADVAPEWCHPVSGKTVRELIAALPEGERKLERLAHP